MSELTEFLRARIAEDEATAHAANILSSGVETISTHTLPEFAEQFTRWQPNRVFAECEAKRWIVETCQGQDEQGPAAAVVADIVLCALATVYADHPDYRPEWKP